MTESLGNENPPLGSSSIIICGGNIMANRTIDSSHHRLCHPHSQENKPSYLLISISCVCVETGIKDPFMLLKHMRRKLLPTWLLWVSSERSRKVCLIRIICHSCSLDWGDRVGWWQGCSLGGSFGINTYYLTHPGEGKKLSKCETCCLWNEELPKGKHICITWAGIFHSEATFWQGATWFLAVLTMK